MLKCAQCGKNFTCDINEGKAHCWCEDFTKVIPSNKISKDCLCPTCLSQRIKTHRGRKKRQFQ